MEIGWNRKVLKKLETFQGSTRTKSSNPKKPLKFNWSIELTVFFSIFWSHLQCWAWRAPCWNCGPSSWKDHHCSLAPHRMGVWKWGNFLTSLMASDFQMWFLENMLRKHWKAIQIPRIYPCLPLCLPLFLPHFWPCTNCGEIRRHVQPHWIKKTRCHPRAYDRLERGWQLDLLWW